jgi:hypothetical protein
MASLNFQKEAAALLFSVLGQKATAATFDSVGHRIEKGLLPAESYVESLLNSAEGVNLYGGKSDLDILSTIYASTYGKAAPEGYLSSLLAQSNLEASIAAVVTNLVNYDGVDTAVLDSQSSYEQQLNLILYPSYNAAGGEKGVTDILALYYLVGIDPVSSTVNTLGSQINSGSKTFEQVATKFIDDRPALKALSNSTLVKLLYTEVYDRAATDLEVITANAFLVEGGSKGQMIANFINDLRESDAAADSIAQQQFLEATTPNAPGFVADLSTQEKVASIFLAIPERNVDAQGLSDWSNYLGSDSDLTLVNALTAKLIKSQEFQKKGAQLTGNDYIQHVYTAVHGVEATPAQLADYANKYGADKALITTMIINDLRSATATATDAATATQQHAFERDIGTSLDYKTAALLSASAADGNATGTVNTGDSHVLSNAETAVLKNVALDANAATVTNLKFADQLANLTINGNAATTVNLSDNGANTGVDVTVNNANTILNASSGDDKVVLAADSGQFNLGRGGDSLEWAGNAEAGNANTVSSAILADGGAGIDTLSANFITKDVNIGSGFISKHKAVITTNASQFTSFEKIDLAGYIGKATVSSGSIATDHTFDFGVLTGHASAESSNNDIYNITQPDATIGRQGIVSSLVDAVLGSGSQEDATGSQGFVLSGLADGVKVINVAGDGAAQLEVTGDATAASSLDFTFQQNATDKFDIAFTANSDTDVNAGSVSLNSSSSDSKLLGKELSTINVASGGNGDFSNVLALTGDNTQVTGINLTGSHHLELTVGDGLSNVTTVDASGNTGGVDINLQAAGIGGTGIGSSWLFDALKAIPLIAALPNALEALKITAPSTISITGTQANDIFSVKGNTNIQGSDGSDVFNIVSSQRDAAVTISDFNYAEDTLVDQQSGFVFSNQESGTQVANFGSKTADEDFVNKLVKFAADSLAGNVITGAAETLITGFFGLSNGEKLSAKVGVSSVSDNHLLIIDQNDDRVLDNSDTVVMLQGGNHADLTTNLYYSPVELNGINLAQFQHEQVA